MVANITQNDFETLARTLYGEARGEGYQGMRAVGAVIMNRVKTGRWGDSIYGVCRYPRQFSCWNVDDPNSQELISGNISERAAMDQAYEVARQILSGQFGDPTNGATHYHTTGVNPSWNRGMVQTAQIGDHRFFKPAEKYNPLQKIGNLFGNAWNGLTTGARQVSNFISSGWQSGQQFFHGALEGAGRAFSNTTNSVGNFARQAVNTVGLGAFMLGSSNGVNRVYPADFMGPIQPGATRRGDLNNFVRVKYDSVRYEYGGKDAERQAGLDCSGFVSSVFRDVFNTHIASAARDQARSISRQFRLQYPQVMQAGLVTAADIPPYAVISIKRPNGSGHVIMVMQDENGNTVSWDSQGNSNNGANNLGRGVTPGTMDNLLRRLRNEKGATVEIVDTTKLFADLKNNNGMLLSSQMLMDAWQVDLETKQRVMGQTVQSSGLNVSNLMLNFTNQLGQQALINRSTFMVNSATGQKILNVAAGMSENWTKFSVITHLAKDQGLDPGRALAEVAAQDPAMREFMRTPELQKMGYGRNFEGMVAAAQSRLNQYGEPVNFMAGGTAPQMGRGLPTPIAETAPAMLAQPHVIKNNYGFSA